MKLFLKENKILIIVYIVMFILIGLGVYEYQRNYGYQKRLEYHEHAIKSCEEFDYSTKSEEEQEFMKNVCDRYKNEEVKTDDTITTFFKILDTKALSSLHLIIPLFIIICSLKKWSNSVKKITLYKKILNCYKQVLIFLGFIVLIFGICYLLSGHFDYNNVLEFNVVSNNFYTTMPYSLLVFFLILALNYILYINISLIVAKYSKNFYLSVLESYIIWLILIFINYVMICSVILNYYLKISINGDAFNLFDFYAMSTFDVLLAQLGATFFLTGITFIIIFLVYHNKNTKKN